MLQPAWLGGDQRIGHVVDPNPSRYWDGTIRDEPTVCIIADTVDPITKEGYGWITFGGPPAEAIFASRIRRRGEFWVPRPSSRISTTCNFIMTHIPPFTIDQMRTLE